LWEFVLLGSSPSAHVQQLSFLGGFPQDVLFNLPFEKPDLDIIKALNKIKNTNRAV